MSSHTERRAFGKLQRSGRTGGVYAFGHSSEASSPDSPKPNNDFRCAFGLLCWSALILLHNLAMATLVSLTIIFSSVQ